MGYDRLPALLARGSGVLNDGDRVRQRFDRGLAVGCIHDVRRLDSGTSANAGPSDRTGHDERCTQRDETSGTITTRRLMANAATGIVTAVIAGQTGSGVNGMVADLHVSASFSCPLQGSAG